MILEFAWVHNDGNDGIVCKGLSIVLIFSVLSLFFVELLKIKKSKYVFGSSDFFVLTDLLIFEMLMIYGFILKICSDL